MSDIGPGDFVEAVRDIDAYLDLPAVGRGSIRRVCRIEGGCEPCAECNDPGAGLVLVGDPDEPYSAVRCAACEFRLIHRPREDFLPSLLRPIKRPITEPVREDA